MALRKPRWRDETGVRISRGTRVSFDISGSSYRGVVESLGIIRDCLTAFIRVDPPISVLIGVVVP